MGMGMKVTSSKPVEKSPGWGRNIKLIVGFTLVAIVAGFLYRFNSILPPLLLTFILTYLLRPLATRLSKGTRLSWRWSVNIIFIGLIIFLITALTLTGVAVVQQFQSLINVVQRFISDLPELVLEITSKIYMIGPFQIDLSHYLSTSNLESFAQEILGIIQPMLGQAGNLVGTLASRTMTTLGWGFFIILVTYFILADMGQVPDRIVQFELPGYDSDIRRIAYELSRIWNAFLRGQIIMFTLSVVVYSILFGILGVRFVLALALVSGLARFVPYVGQFVNWIVLVLVVAFQSDNYFGLSTFQYVILVVAFVFVIDQVFDNIISPRILGQSIGVHPAAVLIAAIIGFSLLGIVGVILAAPGLASLTMLGGYISRKMLDLDPWPEKEEIDEEFKYPWVKWIDRIRSFVKIIIEYIKQKRH
jgi:predicted PurR-regulated permease PerM